MSLKIHFKKLQVLDKVNCLMSEIGYLYMDGLELYNTIDKSMIDVHEIVRAYFGKHNFDVFRTYVKYDLLQSKIYTDIENSVYFYDDLCEYIIILEHQFYHIADDAELLSDMSLVDDYKEIHEIKMETLELAKGIQALHSKMKSDTEDALYIKSRDRIKVAEELKEFIMELHRISNMKLLFLKLKKQVKKSSKITTCCN